MPTNEWSHINNQVKQHVNAIMATCPPGRLLPSSELFCDPVLELLMVLVLSRVPPFAYPCNPEVLSAETRVEMCRNVKFSIRQELDLGHAS